MQLVLSANVKVLILPHLPQLTQFLTSPVIRMFGIFTHAQLDRRRFWDSLSCQLQQKGPDYIERCTFRNKPLSTGGGAVLPALFPLFPNEAQDIPQAAQLVKVREEDMNDVSWMTCALQIY